VEELVANCPIGPNAQETTINKGWHNTKCYFKVFFATNPFKKHNET
jgi:hypothetical protein